MHRLVETYYIIGLKQESEKYAKLLGYNYQSSEWYEMTYSLFDKKYVKIKQSRQSRNKVNSRLIKKIKSLFEWDEKKRIKKEI